MEYICHRHLYARAYLSVHRVVEYIVQGIGTHILELGFQSYHSENIFLIKNLIFLCDCPVVEKWSVRKDCPVQKDKVMKSKVADLYIRTIRSL